MRISLARGKHQTRQPPCPEPLLLSWSVKAEQLAQPYERSAANFYRPELTALEESRAS